MSKIKKISFKVNSYEYIKPFRIAPGTSLSTNNLEVILETEEGYVGFGEATPSFRVTGERIEALIPLESPINELLKGKDTKNFRRLFELIDKFFAFPSLKTALQYAILDALSEEIKLPVYQILGGGKEEIETDKTVSVGSIEERVKEAEEIFKEGFRVIKIKVGLNLYEDIEAMEEIAKRTKGATYIVDANTAYTPKQALIFTKELYKRGIDIALLEQPVSAHDLEGLKYVRFNSAFPIAGDESIKNRYDALRAIKMEAVDYINIKLMKCGISDALSMVELANTANIKLMIGCMGESSLGINQSIHFSAGLGVFEFHDLDSALMIKEDKFRGKYRIKIPYYIPN
ncbi:L-Ala-D/L-Glu epimerase [Dictyoglomus thermophilum]|uniref:Dipeptide epimerase n=1 Tax=Dictyoglomus thermophilum (strain ATCC 35947 / DSM 3960 / H-6-12) TaxID=309799 RepID=B5YB43_DICT6|nr:L-Ala-D/L-Glu epimerase [Dictyoglomus thermophilum]ACI19106.1 muconate cycloisomerase [Dictyoglomus thermophilum H-6-12]